jgi:hypothetical protein
MPGALSAGFNRNPYYSLAVGGSPRLDPQPPLGADRYDATLGLKTRYDPPSSMLSISRTGPTLPATSAITPSLSAGSIHAGSVSVWGWRTAV